MRTIKYLFACILAGCNMYCCVVFLRQEQEGMKEWGRGHDSRQLAVLDPKTINQIVRAHKRMDTVHEDDRRLLNIHAVKEEMHQYPSPNWNQWCEHVQKPAIFNSPSAFKWADKHLVKQKIHNLIPNIRFAKEYASVTFPAVINERLLRRLPSSFLMKSSDSSGGVVLVKNKVATLLKKKIYKNIEDKIKGESTLTYLRRICSIFLATTYGAEKGELWYKSITKRCIFEEVFPTDSKAAFRDYKVFIINNEPVFLQIDKDRFTSPQRSFVTPKSFQQIPMDDYHHLPQLDVLGEKPEFFDSLVSDAVKIAKAVGTPFVRVDFFAFGNVYAFAEVTFAPASCVQGKGNFPEKYEHYFGFVQTNPQYKFNHEDILLL